MKAELRVSEGHPAWQQFLSSLYKKHGKEIYADYDRWLRIISDELAATYYCVWDFTRTPSSIVFEDEQYLTCFILTWG